MRLPCVRVFVGSFVCVPYITFTLFYDPREHRTSIDSMYGVHPIAVDSSHMHLPCVRAFVGSFVCEPNITFTLFYDPREHRAPIQTHRRRYGVRPIAVDSSHMCLPCYRVWRPPNDRCRLIPSPDRGRLPLRPGIRWLTRLRTEHHFHFIL